MAGFFMVLLMLFSILLILVILIQRGRGGGLAGAFGGAGGQSAFGTKAGDVFTKITIVLITIWVLLAGTSGVLARRSSERLQDVPVSSQSKDDGVAPGAGAASTSGVGAGSITLPESAVPELPAGSPAAPADAVKDNAAPAAPSGVAPAASGEQAGQQP